MITSRSEPGFAVGDARAPARGERSTAAPPRTPGRHRHSSADGQPDSATATSSASSTARVGRPSIRRRSSAVSGILAERHATRWDAGSEHAWRPDRSARRARHVHLCCRSGSPSIRCLVRRPVRGSSLAGRREGRLRTAGDQRATRPGYGSEGSSQAISVRCHNSGTPQHVFALPRLPSSDQIKVGAQVTCTTVPSVSDRFSQRPQV
jgi:hypothetical protein